MQWRALVGEMPLCAGGWQGALLEKYRVVAVGYLVDGEDYPFADGLGPDRLIVNEQVEHIAALVTDALQESLQRQRVEQHDAGNVQGDIGDVLHRSHPGVAGVGSFR